VLKKCIVWTNHSIAEEPSSPSAALLSAAWPVMDVGGQMFRQIVSPCKALAAGFTVIGTFAGVDPQVSCQIGFAAESAAAEETHKWPLASVLANV
jgi:hypothetical protein